MARTDQNCGVAALGLAVRHWISWAVVLGLTACQPANDDRPALTRQQLLNPESCKDCHPKHYREWSASMHAYAAKDPVFMAMNKRGQEETNGALREFCVNCHAPMAVRENAISDFADLSHVPDHLQGVTCYFCHNAVGVSAEHSNANVMLANDDVMRAALNKPLQPSTHRVQYSEYHDGRRVGPEASRICGTCHDIKTPMGVRLERTLEEYESSIFAQVDPLAFQSCLDCHMPSDNHKQPAANSTGRAGETGAARTLHEHLWAAVDVPLTAHPYADAALSAVGQCELPARSISYFNIEPVLGPTVQFSVTIETNAGHDQPSGAAQDRRLWVEAIAYDAAGNEVERQGVVGDGEPEESADKRHPFMLRDRLKDAAGNETHMFWKAASYESNLLPPATPMTSAAGSHSRTSMFRLQTSNQPAKVVVRVRMRPMGVDVLSDLVASGHLAPDLVKQMPTFTVLSKEATWVKENANYTVRDITEANCDDYRCKLDPAGADCMH